MSLLSHEDDEIYAMEFARLVATTSKPGRPFADHAWQIATRYAPMLHRMAASNLIETAMIDAAAGRVGGIGGTPDFRTLALEIATQGFDPAFTRTIAAELERVLEAAAATKLESASPSEDELKVWQLNPAAAAQGQR
jgi:hypothetical protein